MSSVSWAREADDVVKQEIEKAIPGVKIKRFDEHGLDFNIQGKSLPLVLHVQRAMPHSWRYPEQRMPFTRVNAVTVELRTAHRMHDIAYPNGVPSIFVKLDNTLNGWLAIHCEDVIKSWYQRGLFRFMPCNNPRGEEESFVGVHPSNVFFGKDAVINLIKDELSQ